MPTIKEMTHAQKEAEIKKTWKPLIDEHGLLSLTDKWQKDNNMRQPMNRARLLGYKAADVAQLFELDFKQFTRKKLVEDRQEMVAARRRKLPPEEEIKALFKPLIDEHGLIVLTRQWQDENDMRKLMGRAGHLGFLGQDIAKLFDLDFEKFCSDERKKEKREKLLSKWKDLVEEHGIRALSYCFADKNGFSTVLNRGYEINLYPKEIAEILNKSEEYEKEFVIFKKYPHDFAGKSEDYVMNELKREWQDIYDEHGISALSSSWAFDHGHHSLNHYTFAMDMNPGKFAEILGVGRAFLNYRKPTKEKFDQKVDEVINKYGCLPGADFLSRNGYTIITHYISKYGPSYYDIREKYGINKVRLRSVDGLRCDSFSEVCFVNYLNAHGIEVVPGGNYPAEYAETTIRKSGRYDPGFVATYGKWKGKQILVEIFGGGRGAQHGYEERKQIKLQFNKRFDNFLAIDYLDCYSDKKLSGILKPFIGQPERVMYHDKIHDAPTTMLSVIDDTLRECQKICEKMPDGILPPQNWFTRSSKYKNRPREKWEPSVWGGLVETIGAIGWKNVRDQMQRTTEQIKWYDENEKRFANIKIK